MSDEAFIREYEPFVRNIVERTRSQLLLTVEPDDLMAYAFEGLLMARERFDAARGVQFKTFAYYRVRGALLDGVRAMGYLPRRAYARMKAAEASDAVAEPLAEARAGGSGDSSVEASVRALDGALGQVAAAYCTAAAANEAETEAAGGSSPEAALLSREHRELVGRALQNLPEQERTLIHGHYLEGRRLDEIAVQLGMSKSWASRLHTRALARMRDALAES